MTGEKEQKRGGASRPNRKAAKARRRKPPEL